MKLQEFPFWLMEIVSTRKFSIRLFSFFSPIEGSPKMQKKGSELGDSVLTQNDWFEWLGLRYSALPWPMEPFQTRCGKPSALHEPRSLLGCTWEMGNLAFGNCTSWSAPRGKGRHNPWLWLPALGAGINLLACRDLYKCQGI